MLNGETLSTYVGFSFLAWIGTGGVSYEAFLNQLPWFIHYQTHTHTQALFQVQKIEFS